MTLKQIAEKMTELGFTKYEALAYISLVQENPATRYEISKRSGVPRSAIYNIIQRLENKGLVNALATKPESYVPLPPDHMIAYLENQYHQRLEEFKKSLSQLKRDFEPGQLWNITGYDNLMLKAKEMIHRATRSIYLSIWQREMKLLRKELEAAVERGVKVVVFSFTRIPEIGLTYSYGLSEKELEKVWVHKLILIRDFEELIMGEANDQVPKKAAWTFNDAIIGIAANHIILDITLYGLRAGVDVSDAVIETQPGEWEVVGKLLEEKFPDNPWLNLDFSRQKFHVQDKR